MQYIVDQNSFFYQIILYYPILNTQSTILNSQSAPRWGNYMSNHREKTTVFVVVFSGHTIQTLVEIRYMETFLTNLDHIWSFTKRLEFQDKFCFLKSKIIVLMRFFYHWAPKLVRILLLNQILKIQYHLFISKTFQPCFAISAILAILTSRHLSYKLSPILSILTNSKP